MADEEIASIPLTFKYRCLPTKAQHEALAKILDDQRFLYNAALQERIDAYRRARKSISYIDQCKSLTEIRKALSEWAAYPLNLQRGTLDRLEKAFQGFFRRVKRGDTPGFPRYRGRGRFDSFTFAEFRSITFDGKRIRFKGLPGGLSVHLHRPLPEGKILTATFKRDCKGWSVAFVVKVPIAPQRDSDRAVGIDVGLASLATLSTGEQIPNPRIALRAEKRLRVKQRALARCQRRSRRREKRKRQLARLHLKIRNARATYLHQVSALLVREYDRIAVERLNVKGLSQSRLAKSIHDAGWSGFKEKLRYKAACAGAELIEVEPAGTSQTCPECGAVRKKTLTERTHRCDCGCVMDRDHAAALVILRRAVVRPVGCLT